MLAIFKKEVFSFFSTPIAALIMGLFLLVCALVLWVFPSNYHIPDSGYAELTPFFILGPALLLLLIPALTMRAIAEERSSGTLELLLTRPVTIRGIVWGKFLAAFSLCVLTLLPTLVYAWSLGKLSAEATPPEWGSMAGSYLGMLFLAAAYTSAGIMASSFSGNQVVALLLGIACCAGIYYLPGILANLHPSVYFLSRWGLESHYQSISRGVLVPADLIFFASVTWLFLEITQIRLTFQKRV